MERLPNLSSINTNTIEGRLLIAAMSEMSVKIYPQNDPDEILQMVHSNAEYIYKNASDLPSYEPQKKPLLEEALRDIINSYSIENRSDTPDYILAQYLSNCLANYESCVKSRDKWFGVDMWADDKIAKKDQHENSPV